MQYAFGEENGLGKKKSAETTIYFSFLKDGDV